MDHFKWTQKMSVGVPVIDAQHKKFFELLNSIEDALIKGEGDDAIFEILRELVQYTQFHFQAEEDFMKERFFKDYPEHRAEHMNFTEHVKTLVRKYRANEGVDASEIRHFMVDWLSKHIMNCDQKYAKFIARAKDTYVPFSDKVK